MSREASLRLPLIEFCKELKPGTQEWESVRAQVCKALEYYGGFEATFYEIPVDIRESIFSTMEEFFALPLETKRKIATGRNYYGYGEPHPSRPLYETLGIDDANMVEMVDRTTKVLWPLGNPRFSESILSYTNNLSKLDQIIRNMVIENLGIEEYIEEHMNSSKYLLRLSKYILPKSIDTKEGLPPHGDLNIVTILHQNEVEALEVETKAGEWITFKPNSPNSFVVIIGDAIDAWTNGRFHRPLHRVIMNEEKIRYSIGLFSNFKAGYIIKAPKELIDEGHPLLYKPYEHNDYLDFLVQTLAATTSKSPLKIYCGI